MSSFDTSARNGVICFVLIDGEPIEEGDLSIEPEFLVEVMELNEEISEAEERSVGFSLLIRICGYGTLF
jgi:hypothetical protein